MTNDEDIPPLARVEDIPPIRTQADLWRHWRALLGPLGFSERLLWVCFMAADGRVAPVLPQISDLPVLPDDATVDSLMHICKHICKHVCNDFDMDSVAVLLSRPGPAGITSVERTWARRLADAATAAGVTMWPVHVANDHEVVPVTPDDLAMPNAASG
jgi:hypothetical protein